MNIRKICTAVITAVVCTFSVPYSSSFAESETCAVTFLDFSGNVMNTLELEKGSTIDYSLVDTSSLDKHIDRFTETRFYAWDKTPETAEEDTVIQALSETGVIKLETLPTETLYLDAEGDVSLDGLSVTITLTVQTTDFDSDGNRISKVITEADIASSCTAVPSDLSEAFANGDSATINIYPTGSDISIGKYTIDLLKNAGDINNDGTTDGVDSSLLLTYYVNVSTGGGTSYSDDELLRADVDRNGIADNVDSSYILRYYTMIATNQHVTWSELTNGTI